MACKKEEDESLFLILLHLDVKLATGGDAGRSLVVPVDDIRGIEVFGGASILRGKPVFVVPGCSISEPHFQPQVRQHQLDAEFVALGKLVSEGVAQLLQCPLGLGSKEGSVIVYFDIRLRSKGALLEPPKKGRLLSFLEDSPINLGGSNLPLRWSQFHHGYVPSRDLGAPAAQLHAVGEEGLDVLDGGVGPDDDV